MTRSSEAAVHLIQCPFLNWLHVLQMSKTAKKKAKKQQKAAMQLIEPCI